MAARPQKKQLRFGNYITCQLTYVKCIAIEVNYICFYLIIGLYNLYIMFIDMMKLVIDHRITSSLRGFYCKTNNLVPIYLIKEV